MKKIAICIMMASLISSIAFSFGSVEEATFKGVPEQNVLSPKNKDGVFDTLTIDFDGKVDIPSSLKITKFFFRLYDQNGTFLFEIDKPLDKATSIPPFVFDGKFQNGDFLADGTYVYTVGILDEKDIESISQPYTIHIDNTAPQVFYSRISSGNVIVPGDEDTVLMLDVETSPEVSWEIEAENSASRQTYVLLREQGDTAFTLPKKWEWNGFDTDNNALPDGDYVLNILAEDMAGNSIMHKVETQIIVSSEGSFLLEMPANKYFSPNSDGARDTLSLSFRYPPSLRLGIDFDIRELVVQTMKNQEVVRIPQESTTEIIFSGLLLDGIPISDGTYNVHLVLENNNVNFTTNMVEVVIDTQEPFATFFMQTSPQPVKSGDPFYFGGELRNTVDIRVKRLDTADWDIEVVQGEQTVYSDSVGFVDNIFEMSVPANIELMDRELPDGLYEISFFSTDLAGNEGRIGPFKAIKDTKPREISVSVDRKKASAFADPINFTFNFDRIGISKFAMFVKNEKNNRVVRSSRLSYGLSGFEWYARNDAGQPVPDGEYAFVLSIEYFNGDMVESSIENILVDSQAPVIRSFSTDSVVMNPTSENEADKYLTVRQQGSEKGVTWTVEIRNIFDTLIYSQTFPDTIADFSWDGKDKDNKIVVDGDYIYRLIGRDGFGNETVKTISFVVDSGVYEQGAILSPGDEMPKIYFPAYSDDIFSLSEKGLLYDNLLYVRSIARLLKAYPTYNVTIVGHAAALLKGAAAEREQIEVLIPLSRNRAYQISKALQILGIDANRIDIRAVGGSQPEVDNPTSSTIWENRRVEFELLEN